MALKVENITFDCSDPDTLAQWWAQAVGGDVNAVAPGEFVILAQPDGAGLAFQRVDDPTPGKNRVHIDFSAADLEAEVKRLVDLGAAETGRHSFGDEFRWVVLADPAGNAFCVAAGG
jgi:predicted enzyme related to lactoylglutathione lyase